MDNQLDKAIFATIAGAIRSILILVLSVGFLGMGMLKVVSMPQVVDYWNYWGFPIWSMYVIGFYELVMAVAIFYYPTRIKAIYGIGTLMLGALGVHLFHKEFNYLIGPIAILLACVMLYFVEQKRKIHES